MNYLLMNAYALGYYDGRAIGVEANPFDSDEERFAYSEGYQRGVSDYRVVLKPAKAFVKSLMTGKTVEIREEDRGGVCDPSQERFWTM